VPAKTLKKAVSAKHPSTKAMKKPTLPKSAASAKSTVKKVTKAITKVVKKQADKK
jgi:hypothetical protein